MSSGDEDWELNEFEYEEDYYYMGVMFYLDDEGDNEDTPEDQPSIEESTFESMDMISTFVQQLNLNSTNVDTGIGQTYFRQAISAKRMDIVQKFIEYEVDINAFDEWNRTPLHYAVSGNNIECVCLLLSYGVDVRMPTVYYTSPLSLAFELKREEIIKLLLYYYYEFSNVNLTNIKFDYKYQLETYSEDIVLLTLAMDNGYVEPFKLIWHRINIYEVIHLPNDRFIQKYLYNSIFEPANKNCLYSMLEIADVRYLLENCKFSIHMPFLSKNFDQTRRMDFIFMFLSTGVKIKFWNIDMMYQICGFNKELEALIYGVNVSLSFDNKLLYSILNFNFNTHTYYEFCEQFIYDMEMDINYSKHFTPWLKYFSLPSNLKRNYCDNCYVQEELSNLLSEVTEFPSLLELGRLAVQNLIKQTHTITKPYQFHDAVKSMRLLDDLKDIVLFKRPIYK